MGIKGTFADLSEYDPSIHSSLKTLLEYEGDDIEEVFMQTFQITNQDVFGNINVHSLKENGDEIFVNQSNKKVSILDTSCFLE